MRCGTDGESWKAWYIGVELVPWYMCVLFGGDYVSHLTGVPCFKRDYTEPLPVPLVAGYHGNAKLPRHRGRCHNYPAVQRRQSKGLVEHFVPDLLW